MKYFKSKNRELIFFGTVTSVFLALFLYGINLLINDTHANLSKALQSSGTEYLRGGGKSFMKVYLKF